MRLGSITPDILTIEPNISFTKGNKMSILCQDNKEKALEVEAPKFDIRVFNCVVTMHNTIKKTHRTFMIRTIQKGEKFGVQGTRVVSMLVGSNRNDPKHWKNFGFVSERGIYVFKSYFSDPFYKTISDMLLNPVKWEQKGVKFLMMGYCRKCNRPLTRPDSLEKGLGPICAKAA